MNSVIPNSGDTAQVLSDADLDRFVRDGFVKLEGAFPRAVADEGRAILWRDTGCDPEDPKTWTKPVIRLGLYGQEPFARAANAAILYKAFDQLVGKGRWLPRMNLGTFPVRFPSPDDPGDAGWHIDISFKAEATDADDLLGWRANVTSKDRALLMLFLFSDVGQDDAPTRIRAGSHLDIARMLAPAGDDGLSLRELAANGFAETAKRHEVLATGERGTVYLCHPFLVHAAQPHRGTRPRFIAQPPLLPAALFRLVREHGDYSPVEQAIRNGCGIQDRLRSLLR
ncbi:MAG: phytanoyl-CoA dioxygenase family protein [Acidobacteriia bacterium]|nr:phytanoyl-CoA dioxygenase family protein [Terriglobia bacterium]